MIKNYYQTLGLESHASQEEIKKAYRLLAKKHHPDASGGGPESEGLFKEINEAYQVLGDERKRQEYDLIINNGFDAEYINILRSFSGMNRGSGGMRACGGRGFGGRGFGGRGCGRRFRRE